MVNQFKRVVITGGREAGGVRAYADGMRSGFRANGLDAKIVERKLDLLRELSSWRNEDTLFILSTWGLLFSPFIRFSVGVAHGWQLPLVDGFWKSFLVSLSLKICALFSPMVAVSGYAAMQLRLVWGLRVDAVIHNPLRDSFLSHQHSLSEEFFDRKSIVYVGRMVEIKQVDLLIDAFEMAKLSDEGFELVVVGDGPAAEKISERLASIARTKYIRHLDVEGVKTLLMKCRVFYSGCLIEAFGISLLEAYSCGANIVCPSVGGFVEVVIPVLEKSVFLFPPNGDGLAVAGAIKRALEVRSMERDVSDFDAVKIAKKYLDLLG